MRCLALSFDLDDTVIDYSVSTQAALRELGAAHAITQWREVSRSAEAQLDRGLLAPDLFETERLRAFEERVRGVAPSDAVLADMVALRERTVAHTVRVYPDALRLLEAARAASVPCVAVSNSYSALRADIMSSLGLDRYFVAVQFCGDGPHLKPDPRAFDAALHRLDVAANQVVHMGDDVTADVRGAQQAGMQAVHVNRRPGSCTCMSRCLASLEARVTRTHGSVEITFASPLGL